MASRLDQLLLDRINRLKLAKTRPANLEELEELTIARINHRFILAYFIVVPPYVPIGFYLETYIHLAVNIICLSLMALVAISYKRRDQSRQFPLYFVLISNFNIIGTYIASGAGDNSMLMWPLLLPLLNYILIPRSLGISLSVISTLISITAYFFYVNYPDLRFIVGRESLESLLKINLIGVPLYIILMVRVLMTKHEALVEFLREKQAELSKVNARHSELMSVLYHDLSNSIFITSNYSSPNRNLNRPPEVMARNMSKIFRASKHIEEIIRQTKIKFMTSKAEKISKTSLQDCLTESIFTFKDRLDSKELTIEVSEFEDCTILVNKASFIVSILNNLISNAIKFTDRGKTIQILITPRHLEVEITIINPATISERVKLSELFKGLGLSSKGTEGEVGHGVGLSIVKSYVTYFGGQIEVNNDLNKVSFTLTLPKA